MKSSLLIAAFVVGLHSQAVFAQAAAKSIAEIQLASGISLADWINLKGKAPSLSTAQEAARYVKEYGPYRELLEIISRASEADEFSAADISEQNAAAKIIQLQQARAALGDWPALTLSLARAYALTGDVAMARQSLRQWLAVSPTNSPTRPEIVELMLKGDDDSGAFAQWAGNQAAFELSSRRGAVASPRRKIGQWWEVKSVNLTSGQESVSRAEVVAVRDDGSYSIKTPSVSSAVTTHMISHFDASGNMLSYESPYKEGSLAGKTYYWSNVPHDGRFQFPLQIGRSWRHTYGGTVHVTGEAPRNAELTFIVEASVKRMEEIELAKHGRAMAIVIDYKRSANSKFGNTPSFGTCWYVPALGLCGKETSTLTSQSVVYSHELRITNWGDN